MHWTKAHDDIAKRLLEAGADLHSQGGYYGNALNAACSHGYVDVVEILLGKGANINAAAGKDVLRPLQYAACGGHERIVQQLLNQGASITPIETETTLQPALFDGHGNVARLLLENGTNLTMKPDSLLHYCTSLAMAASQGYADIVDLLIAKGASINVQSPNKRCALSEATRNGHTKIVRRLLQGGAEVNVTYNSPLLLASSEGNNEILDLLIQAGADVNLASSNTSGLYRGDGNGIQLAAANRHADAVEMLLQIGADIYSTIGDSALQRALDDKHEKVVRLLLENGADMATLRDDVHKVLRLACYGGHDAIVDYAIQQGADVNALGDPSGSPIQAASANGHMSTVKKLLERGAHVNNTARFWSALQQASHGGHTNVVSFYWIMGRNLVLGLRNALAVARTVAIASARPSLVATDTLKDIVGIMLHLPAKQPTA